MFSVVKKFIRRLKIERKLYVAYDSGGKNKPTIVLLHGVAATHQTLDVLISELGDEFRIISLDMLGFGRSPKPSGADYTVDEHCIYVRRTLRGLHLKRPYIIIGHSMGAIVATHYARRYPWEVRSLYLLSLPIYINDNELHTGISRAHTDMYLNAYKFLINNREFTIKHCKNLRALFNIDNGIDVNEDNWDGFRLSLANTIINQDVYGDIMRVKIPIHILYGALDEFLVRESLAQLDRFANVTITKVGASDHSVNPRFAKKVASIVKKDQ